MALKENLGANQEFASIARLRIFSAIIIAFSLIYIGQLAYLQLYRGRIYKYESESQAIKKVPLEPFRGNIFDRKGNLLVHNKPSFSITLTPNDFKVEEIPLLCSILPIDSAIILKAIKDEKNYPRFTPWRIWRDAGNAEISLIEEYGDYLPGIDIVVESKRLYEFEGNMAHILGYTREVSPEQMKKHKYFKLGDVIGQSGIENTYDNYLRGEEGFQFVAVNSAGKAISSFDRGKNDIPATSGFDLELSIDKKLQEKAEELLGDKHGAVVAIDPNNGEILILASKPDYDPRQFSGKVPADIYNALANDPGNPLYHRAIQSQYPPGSTIKMLWAIAALQEGLINEHTLLNCIGFINYGGRPFKCHGGAHGNLNVQKAIQVSCNSFFYQVGLKLGMKYIEKYGAMFGFGSRTMIDLPNEKSGRLPTLAWLNKPGNSGFFGGKLLNYGIGQGEILVTPLQMAEYAAALGNRGTFYQPHIVRSIFNNVTNKFEPNNYLSRNIKIDSKIWDLIHNAMYDVVNTPGGTANNAKIDGISVCGKTGTAQNPHGRDHSWFICYAPKDNPKIAMSVLVENAGFGATVAAPIAQELLMGFFYPETLKKKAEDSVKTKSPGKIDSVKKILTVN